MPAATNKDLCKANIQLEVLGKEFRIKQGVRQGDPLSPKLSLAVLENVFRNLDWKYLGLNIGGRKFNHLRFADNLVLLEECPKKLEKLIQTLNTESVQVDLKMNITKVKLMPNSKMEPIEIEEEQIDNMLMCIATWVANGYRDNKKTKLQRTFVSASDAAEDRARGVKREGGIIVDVPPKKSNKIEFVKPGHVNDNDAKSDDDTDDRHTNIEVAAGENTNLEVGQEKNKELEVEQDKSAGSDVVEVREERVDYLAELSQMECVDVRRFRYNMFGTRFGKMVLMVRPWAGKLWNILSTCQVCGLSIEQDYDKNTGSYKVIINQILVAEVKGATKQLAKKEAGDLAWNILKEEAVIVFVKERFIAQNDSRISLSDVSGNARPGNDEFGTPVETSVATKMMKMMGWKGGGLGVDAQGIAEPIKPHLQMVNRAGLGSMSADVRQIKRAAEALMRRYIDSDCLDVDLVFSNDFSKEERAALHLVAKKAHLVSRSYGQAADRFLVVRKKLDPFSLVQAVLDKGGCTPKYQIFIPAALDNQYNGRNIVR